MKKLIVLTCTLSLLTACGDSIEKKAGEKLAAARAAFEHNDYNEAKLQIDVEKNLHRSFLRFQVNEQGVMTLTSIYCGPSNIHHVAVKVIAPDGSFAETPASNDSYETTDLGEKIEKADYKMGEDGNVLSFLYMNRDKKNIRVEYLGERKFSTTMTPSDREALVGTYELAKLLSSIRQIQQEKEEANLKIEFVKRKMEQKAQEEAAEK